MKRAKTASRKPFHSTPAVVSLLVCAFGALAPGFADGEKLTYMPLKTPEAANRPSSLLHGGVQTIERLPPPPYYNPYTCPRVNGFSTYQQAWYALGQKQYKVAADMFQIAGDQMEATGGESRFLAEARFAEAQTRRLMGQYDRSYSMYKRSIELFQKTDPRSFYLKAAQDALKDMLKNNPPPLRGEVKKNNTPLLKAMPLPEVDKVSGVVTLSSHITQLDTGTAINTLHNGDFFNRSRGTLMQSAGVDISEDYVKNTLHKAFLKMNCQETTVVGANHYSATLFYRPIMTSDGKVMAVGVGSDLLSPSAEVKINGKNYKISMDLPHVSPNTRNVMLCTDDRHVIAIDPRTSEAWRLEANFSKKVPDFNWFKLGRDKTRKFSS